jgi:DNA replication and repair protein RecF
VVGAFGVAAVDSTGHPCLLNAFRMRIRQLTLRHFRNVGSATLPLVGRQQFFVGANGQGKTNLLEAAGLITALRSFRASDTRLLIAHGQAEAGVASEVEHEVEGQTRVAITLRPTGKEVWADESRLTRLSEYLGRFPTVVFSSQDLQLVRGAPAQRRRWLDLTLASIDAHYLRTLQAFTRALAGRNALLKRGDAADAELAAFEQALAPAAAELIRLRAAGVAQLSTGFDGAYGRLTDSGEHAAIAYAPDLADPAPEALAARWQSSRGRDRLLRTTVNGPQRDDLDLRVQDRMARDFASEGQQRSLVLALRLAQAACYQARSGVRPVLLADDVLGELDPERRRRFWSGLDPASQILATGTSLPDAELGAWQVFHVSGGIFEEVAR